MDMNRLTTAKRVAVVAALVEGNSVRATARHDRREQADNPQAAVGAGRCVRDVAR